MFVDSHCHLDRLDLTPYDGSVDGAIAMARAVGVSGILNVSVDLIEFPQIVATAARHPGVWATCGLHPLEVAEPLPTIEQLVDLAREPLVVALGETGLDGHYGSEQRALQEESFRRHLLASKQLRKPVVVHSRAARSETLAMLEQYADPEVAGVLHCFTEDWPMAARALELNFYVSLSGIVTFKTANELREVARRLPLDRLLIETDAPYLAPIPYRGKRNEPRYLPAVARYLAELKGISLEALAEQTSANFCRLFRIDPAQLSVSALTP